MKVKVKEVAVFKPIEITLESEEEAEVLWVVLSRSTDDDEQLFKKELPKSDPKRLVKVTEDMYGLLNAKFTPEGQDC